MPVSQYHVFSYSERPGTQALKIPHVVTPEQKHERSQQVLRLSETNLRAFYNKYIGTVRPVLLEHSRRKGVISGFTDNYIRVETSLCSSQEGGILLGDNEVVPLLLTGWNEKGDALKGITIGNG